MCKSRWSAPLFSKLRHFVSAHEGVYEYVPRRDVELYVMRSRGEREKSLHIPQMKANINAARPLARIDTINSLRCISYIRQERIGTGIRFLIHEFHHMYNTISNIRSCRDVFLIGFR